MDHRSDHYSLLLLRRRLGRLRLRVQQRLQQWLWLQQRLLLNKYLAEDAGLRVRVFCIIKNF